MQNPGLKYLASPPPMKAPHTQNQGGYGVPPEPATLKEDVTVGPPMAGGSSSNPVSAENGDHGDHDVFGLDTSYPDKPTGIPKTYLAGEGTGETQVPGDVRQHANLPDIGQEDAAEQRRIDHQKQVGGGAWENEAYDSAQDRIMGTCATPSIRRLCTQGQGPGASRGSYQRRVPRTLRHGRVRAGPRA